MVVDSNGKVFEERRKCQRRKKQEEKDGMAVERRDKTDRRNEKNNYKP